jgi:hypothetical protein
VLWVNEKDLPAEAGRPFSAVGLLDGCAGVEELKFHALHGLSVQLLTELASLDRVEQVDIMRARREGFLTEALEGREGGEATPKARKLIADLT